MTDAYTALRATPVRDFLRLMFRFPAWEELADPEKLRETLELLVGVLPLLGVPEQVLEVVRRVLNNQAILELLARMIGWVGRGFDNQAAAPREYRNVELVDALNVFTLLLSLRSVVNEARQQAMGESTSKPGLYAYRLI